MSNHTPGPWKARGTLGPLRAEHLKGPFVIEVESTGQHLTTMNGWRSDQQEVDARLMAAAPELLDALIEIINAADGEGWKQLDPSLSKARAAIAKAKGDSHGS